MKIINQKKLNIKFIKVFLLMFLTSKVIALGIDDTRPAEFAHENDQLNKIYKKILGKMSISQQIETKKSQRVWITFRDLDCNWAFIGESLDCLIDRTHTRTEELKEFFELKGKYYVNQK